MATTTKNKNGKTEYNIDALTPEEIAEIAGAGVIAQAPAPTTVYIPEIKVRTLRIRLRGDSPLIVHRWSEKAKKEMLDKQMKVAKTAKEAKNPEEDYRSSLYIHEDGGYGFPAVGFKAAAVGACRFADGIKMTEARGAFHVQGELVKIEGEPSMREDMVRVGMGVADIRYRGEFKEWACEVEVVFNPSAMSAEQIVNLFNLAGFGVGVGEWRPEKNGPYGRFHVENEADRTATEAAA